MNDLPRTPEAPPPFPPLPSNGIALSLRAHEDGVHCFLRLTYDATAFSEPRQRLLAHWLSAAMGKFVTTAREMSDEDVRRELNRLGSLESGTKPN